MSDKKNILLESSVRPEWVDYNGHMNDAEYARVFSIALDSFMNEIGIDEGFRNQQKYSIFTLETHLCYLAEASVGESLLVTVQLLDSDAKRLHVFFVMENSEGRHLATSEQMLMGMDMKEGRPAPFPADVAAKVTALEKAYKNYPIPEDVGKKIGIRKK